MPRVHRGETTTPPVRAAASGPPCGASFGLDLELAAGDAEDRDQVTVVEASVEYVVFAGTVKHVGRDKKPLPEVDVQQLDLPGGDAVRGLGVVTVITDGTLRCDLDAPNRVARKAKAVYCG